MATETELRKKFVAALRKVNTKVVPYVGSTMGDQGTADVFIAHTRWHGWIEFKGPTTKIKPLQVLFIRDMRRRGCPAHIIRLLENKVMKFVGPDAGGHVYHWQDGVDILDAILEEESRCLK